MKQTVEYYISELLYDHDCVIIPGFGGFIGNKKSAYIDPVSNVIYPPSKQLLFNRNLTENDGLLATYIVKKEGGNLSDAINMINDFIELIESKLNEDNTITLKKIGSLKKGDEGNISFSQDHKENYNLNTFGLQSKKDLEKIERTSKTKDPITVTIPINKDMKIPMSRIAAILIPLIAISLFSITLEERINSVYSQMANLIPFDSKKIKVDMSVNVIEKGSEININLPIKTTGIIEVSSSENNISGEAKILGLSQKKKYYIIGGAFNNQENANRLLRKFKKENYNSEILSNNTSLRVSYDSFSNKEDAIIALYSIRKKNSSAWILTQ